MIFAEHVLATTIAIANNFARRAALIPIGRSSVHRVKELLILDTSTIVSELFACHTGECTTRGALTITL